MTLILRNVRPWGGENCDLAIVAGRISARGLALPRGSKEIDGGGGLILPGLHDHHLHLLATAVRRQSVSLAGLTSGEQIHAALAAAPGASLRAVDYDERACGLPDTRLLDSWVPDRPLRLADRTGALWVLNSAAMQRLASRELPAGAERDGQGHPTGRFWREDRWMRSAFPAALPDLAALGRSLAAVGVTAVTDATAHNGPEEAGLLAGSLPQRLTLMGSEALSAGNGYALGPLKLLIDERDPASPEGLATRIGIARSQGRAVAAHCVTEAELALYLAALELAGGVRRGDRVEHGGMVPAEFISLLSAAGLTVVTNPAFIHDRGDRYLSEIAPDQQEHLYPAAALVRSGVPVLAGSDAPYAALDPWLAMRTARDRLTAAGVSLGPAQRLNALGALRLYCRGDLTVGAPADLVMCAGDLPAVLRDLSMDRVRLTMIGGRVVHHAP